MDGALRVEDRDDESRYCQGVNVVGEIARVPDNRCVKRCGGYQKPVNQRTGLAALHDNDSVGSSSPGRIS